MSACDIHISQDLDILGHLKGNLSWMFTLGQKWYPGVILFPSDTQGLFHCLEISSCLSKDWMSLCAQKPHCTFPSALTRVKVLPLCTLRYWESYWGPKLVRSIGTIFGFIFALPSYFSLRGLCSFSFSTSIHSSKAWSRWYLLLARLHICSWKMAAVLGIAVLIC